MLVGYIRETKGGLSRSKQETLLRAAGISDFKEESPAVFVDRPKRAGRKAEPEHLIMRAQMVQGLRQDDIVIVADFATLGVSSDDWLAVVGQIAATGASLRVCDPDTLFSWPDGSRDIAARLAEGAALVQAALTGNRTKNARAAKAKRGIHRGASRVDPAKIEAARELWGKDDLSGAQIAARVGCSESTLRRRLGAITLSNE